jgi:hypothetical protein
MIRKSGHRFSEKTMLKTKKQSRMAFRRNVILVGNALMALPKKF